MSNWGKELTMEPQKVKEKATVSGELLLVIVNTSKGSFQLILSDQPETISIELQTNSQQIV